jgi:hypothetical protein
MGDVHVSAARDWLARLARAKLLLLVVACGQRPHAEVEVVVDLPPEVAPEEVVISPAASVHASRVFRDSRLVVLADGELSHVTLRARGLCPTDVPVRASAERATAKRWIDLGEDKAQVGYGAPFDVDVTAGCPDAEAGDVTWRQVEGPPLTDLRTDRRGFHLHARTRPLAELRGDPMPWGIVPVSPRTQGRYVLEATWVGDGVPVHETVTITSAARASGVPSIAVGQRVMLGGRGWHVTQAPAHGAAEVRSPDGLTEFEPDAPGRWVLADEAGKTLRVRAGLHDRVPLDCGRGDCHASEAAAENPMARALTRFFQGGAFPEAASCALDCHTVGERGLHDGGFLDVAKSLRFRPVGATWDELPRALRRVGGVTCSGCHGPAAIPEPSARASVLSPDVCAMCHDAPPAYTHVEQWRRSRMARASEPAAAREGAACARCHTTAGFLASIGVRKPDTLAPPDPSVGVACAACHAPHSAHTGDKILRAPPAPTTASGRALAERAPSSALCAACHAPAPDEAFPSASAALVWLGQAELPGGKELAGPSPHAGVEGGCVGCHGGTRPTEHSFRADPARCTPCHEGGVAEHPGAGGKTVEQRARDLWTKLGGAAGKTLHAGTSTPAAGDRARALYEVALVLEDPAAGTHNAPFARRLLDDAEQAVSASTP